VIGTPSEDITVSRSKQLVAAIVASLGLAAAFQVAEAQPYSPAVPFEQVPVHSQIIGGAYIPAHLEPQMVQPGQVYPRATPVSSAEQENQALNALASEANASSEDQALAALQSKSVPQKETAIKALPTYHVAVSAPAIGKGKPPHVHTVVAQKPGIPTHTADAWTHTAPQARSSSPSPQALPAIRTKPLHIGKPLHVKIVHPMTTEYTVDIRPGESLAAALRTFLHRHGWRLEWLDKKNFVPAFNNAYSANSMVSLIRQIKDSHPMFHFSMYTTNKVVVVTPFSAQLQHVQFDAGE
jgi:hypothetical protein